jgi:antitoxin VapB
MALNIRNREAEQLAERLANLTHETKTAAVTTALRDRLARVQRQRSGRRLADDLDAIALRCAQLPVLDSSTLEEILGYGSDGLPK